MKCTNCGRDEEMKPTTVQHSIKVGDAEITGRLAGLKCPCGEVFFDYAALGEFERAVAKTIIRSGNANGATFRFLRQVAGLKAKDLASLLDTTPETISRWEKGARPVDRAAWVAVACLALDREPTMSILKAAASPSDMPKRVKVA